MLSHEVYNKHKEWYNKHTPTESSKIEVYEKRKTSIFKLKDNFSKMKINTTSQTLYFLSGLTILSFLALVYLFYDKIYWNEFINAAGIFLPVIIGSLIAALLLFLGIYLMIKAINLAKEKNTAGI